MLTKSYGEGISAWDVIFVVGENPGTDSCKYNKRTNETGIHLSLNYKDFKSSSFSAKVDMIFEGLIKSLEKLQMQEIPNVQFGHLKQELLSHKSQPTK